MKTKVKHALSRFGILPYLDSLRRRGETREWIRNGCTDMAPQPVKRSILKYYLRHYGLNHFVETGTHHGDTLAYIAHDRNVSCTSIELADVSFENARERFASYKNVSLLHGDSGALMPGVVSQLKEPVLFWLDGHYSGGVTARGDLDTPVSLELQAILASPIGGHVILIDDVRCFDGTGGYPELGDLISAVRRNSGYHVEVSTDIIRLTPRPG
jgi:hypothetical protein